MSSVWVSVDVLRHRLVRAVVWFLAALLSWFWFSTNTHSEYCISDGLDGTCQVDSLNNQGHLVNILLAASPKETPQIPFAGGGFREVPSHTLPPVKGTCRCGSSCSYYERSAVVRSECLNVYRNISVCQLTEPYASKKSFEESKKMHQDSLTCRTSSGRMRIEGVR